MVSIVLFLIALLAPVLESAREKARQDACAGNMRQLCTAMLMYAGDYDENLCRAKSFDPDSDMPDALYICNTKRLIWSGMLFPYTANIDLVQCPSATHNLVNPYAGRAFDGLHDTLVNNAQFSIGMNSTIDPFGTLSCLASGYGGPACQVPAAIDSFPLQSQSVLFADSVPIDPDVDPSQYNLGFLVSAAFPVDATGGPSDRHRSGLNVAALDGHVSWYPISSVIANRTSLDFSDYPQNFPCQNYNNAGLIWDRTAPDPSTSPACPS